MNEIPRIVNNARVVAEDRVFEGGVVLEGERIVEVFEGSPPEKADLDMGGDYLLPGLVEMHTDHLETQFIPRPGILWPSSMAALLAHDNQIIGSGITTVLNGICCGEMHEGKRRKELLAMSIMAVRKARAEKLLRSDHLLHLRCEVCDPLAMDHFQPYAREELVKLVSIMDHTPGQRQFTDPAKYRSYYRNMNWTDEEFTEVVRQAKQAQERCAPEFRAMIMAQCRELNIPVASHDDTTVEHVEHAHGQGMAISEFPTSLSAARKARELGMAIVLGAPNVVRGGSHSGNVSARDLAAQGLLDVLSSDYVPGSLMHAPFVLHQELGLDLHQAVNTVSANPARVLGLDDRGAIAPGRRADLVRVAEVDKHPVVRAVWRQGVRVA